MKNVEKAVLERLHYTGHVDVAGVRIAIGFFLSAGQDSRLVFEFDPISDTDYFQIRQYNSSADGSLPDISLYAQSENGFVITSKTVNLVGWRSGSSGNSIKIDTRAAELTIPLQETQPSPVLRLWFRSFKSFVNPVISTPLGKLSVRGATHVNDIDDMSGNISISADTPNVEANWSEKADAFLTHMHHGLSFAHGGRLQTPRLDYYAGNTLTSTFYAGEAFRSEFAIQYSLHHAPIITALTDRYFSKGPLPELLWTALGWVQVDSTINEVRFLTGMTALESIIQHLLPQKNKSTVPAKKFKPIKKAMEAVIKNSEGLNDNDRETLIRQLSDINRMTLADKIEAVFIHFGISRRDLDRATIGGLASLRNKIVHQGTFPNGTDQWAIIILVREIVTRILLAEIGFSGRYICFIGQRHDRQFELETVIKD